MATATKTPRASAKEAYVRISASKVRQVLNLIRGASYEDAKDILDLTERKAAANIRHCLDSAANNAENKDMNTDEVYISECYANEGKTLHRWRARARGHSTRINKRTSTITIALSLYSPKELEQREQAGKSQTAGRQRAAEPKANEEVAESTEEVEEAATEEAPVVEDEKPKEEIEPESKNATNNKDNKKDNKEKKE